jgi:hypothetical protein
MSNWAGLDGHLRRIQAKGLCSCSWGEAASAALLSNYLTVHVKESAR